MSAYKIYDLATGTKTEWSDSEFSIGEHADPPPVMATKRVADDCQMCWMRLEARQAMDMLVLLAFAAFGAMIGGCFVWLIMGGRP